MDECYDQTDQLLSCMGKVDVIQEAGQCGRKNSETDFNVKGEWL